MRGLHLRVVRVLYRREFYVSVLAAVATVASACSHGQERVVLQEFFEASRLRDRTAAQRVSTILFEPRADGIVTTFTIRAVGEQVRKRLDWHTDARIVDKSIENVPDLAELRKYDGQVVSETVKLSAPVRLPSGETAEKTLNVILQRAIVKNDREIVGRWIVTGIVVR